MTQTWPSGRKSTAMQPDSTAHNTNEPAGMAIPQASKVDYSDVGQIIACQQAICTIYVREGACAARRRRLMAEGSEWLRRTKPLLTDGPLADIPALIPAYDLMHRVCTGEPCPTFLSNVRFAAVKRWLAGDKSLTDTDITLLIVDQMDTDAHSVDERYARYCFGQVQQWIDELTHHGHFRNIAPREANRRLDYLLNRDLTAYLGTSAQTAAKRAWAAARSTD